MNSRRYDLDDDELKALLVRHVAYNPETGLLSRKEKLRGNGAKPAGAPIHGTKNSDGYLYCSPLGRGMKVLNHRLAWLIMTGAWPVDGVDHIDHDMANNAWLNLREADQAVNSTNTSMNSRNTSGVNGVSWNKRREKWLVQVNRNGRLVHSLNYPDLLSAVAARYSINRQYGFHENHGKGRRGSAC